MKCLSVNQPWATLIVIGAKQIETRSWETKHRGPLLIHASRKFHDQARVLCEAEPFRSVLKAAGYNGSADLPLGQIIGFVTLTDCKAVNPCYGDQLPSIEKAFGDFRPGRFAWKAADAFEYQTPLPFSGRLSIFEVPDQLIAKLMVKERAPMKLHCRPTRGKHIKKIAKLEERCYGKYALTACQICHMLQQKFAFGFIAIAGKQLAGHALCIFDPEEFTINLTHVALDPKLDAAFDVDDEIIKHAKSLVQRLAFAKLRVYMPAEDKEAAVAAKDQGWKKLATTTKIFGDKKATLYEWAWEPFYGASLN